MSESVNGSYSALPLVMNTETASAQQSLQQHEEDLSHGIALPAPDQETLSRLGRNARARINFEPLPQQKRMASPSHAISGPWQQEIPKKKYVSDDGKMALSVSGDEYIDVHPSVSIADAVLKIKERCDNGNRMYAINMDYVEDCSEYAQRLLGRIVDINYKKERMFYEAINVAEGPTDKIRFDTLFRRTVSAEASPDIGQAFLAVNDPDDPRSGNRFFNFHWAVVIAKSGSDVITAEAGFHPTSMQFQMYSVSEASESFRQRYIDMGNLGVAAKVFTINPVKKDKEMLTETAMSSAEVIEL